MNWTEGSLSRHARTRQQNSGFRRQKEFFAKARAGLLNSSYKPTSDDISFLHTSSSPILHQVAKKRKRQPGDETSKYKRTRRSTHSPSAEPVAGLSHHFGGLRSPSACEVATKSPNHDQEVEEKSRRMLEKNDWVGLKMQRPLPMSFAEDFSNRHGWRQRIPRRSKLKYLLGSRCDEYVGKKSAFPNSGRPLKTKIRVGSQEFRLGPGSSTYSGRHPAGQKEFIDDRERSLRNLGEIARFAEDERQSPHDRRPRSSNCDSARAIVQYPGEHRVTTPSQANYELRSPTDSRHRYILTSSPLIYQPVPRFPLSKVLRPDSEASPIAGSTLAELGISRPVITSSQEGENQQWKKLVGVYDGWGGFRGTDNSLTGSRSPGLGPAISPGISEQLQEPRDFPPASEDHPYSAVSLRLLDGGTDAHGGKSDTASETKSADSFEANHNGWQVRSGPAELDELEQLLSQRHLNDTDRTATESTADNQCMPTMSIPTPRDAAPNTRLTKPSVEHHIFEQQVTALRTYNSASEALTIPIQRKPQASDSNAAAKQTDPDSFWQKFILGDEDSGDLVGLVFKEAVQEAARELRPSETSETFDSGNTVTSDSVDYIRSATGASASHNATTGSDAEYGSPEFEFIADDVYDDTSLQGEYGSTVVATRYHPLSTNLSEERHTSAEPASTFAEPAQSAVGIVQGREPFRFAPPKMFIGKLANSTASASGRRSPGPVYQLTLKERKKKQRQKGRTKKRDCDGRADIRALPNFTGDPIEEFDDVILAKPSLFGVLETE